MSTPSTTEPVRGTQATGDEQKWFNSPVTFSEGSLSEIRKHVPSFERRRFGLIQPDERWSSLNKRLDTIVRRPFGEDQAYVPVGVVSSEYSLLPHTAVLDVAGKVLAANNIPQSAVKVQLRLSEYGERMNLSVFLPEKYQFDPGDGYPMALRLEFVNSVEGSTRFRVLMGWFRFICSNGLVIGVTRFEMRRRHVGELALSDVGRILTSGLAQSSIEKQNFKKWRKIPICPSRLNLWVDKKLQKLWGFKASARAFYIARFGSDAEIHGQYKDQSPTTILMLPTKPVPGAPSNCENLFDLSQTLAWLAKERRDVQEQLEWREQIPGLLSAYMRMSVSQTNRK